MNSSATARTAGRSSLRAPGLDWLLMGASFALILLGTLLVWSATSTRNDLTGGETTAYLTKQLVNVAIGVVLALALGSCVDDTQRRSGLWTETYDRED